ncbi:MAG: hypothetical protein AB7E46_05775 [Desulfovibrio sp.]|jgi:hypothetical protein
MPSTQQSRTALSYLAVVALSVLALQTVVVIAHEFTHSTVAWLLGQMDSPGDIIWGNPFTLSGWDEGVEYHRLFAAGQLTEAAIIGVSPLLLHAGIVSCGLALLVRGRPRNRWAFHALYWFVVTNLMELIAYLLMRAFASGGDTGIFNRGMQLNPWFLFCLGNLALAAWLGVLFGKVLPRMNARFAAENPLGQWLILGLTAFVLFLWGSGLRIVLYVYPDPQWLFGLLGFAAFGAALALCQPSRPWMARRTQAR